MIAAQRYRTGSDAPLENPNPKSITGPGDARDSPCPRSQSKSHGPGRGGSSFGGFTSLKLVSSKEVSHDTKLLRFEVPESKVLDFKPSCKSTYKVKVIHT